MHKRDTTVDPLRKVISSQKESVENIHSTLAELQGIMKEWHKPSYLTQNEAVNSPEEKTAVSSRDCSKQGKPF